MRRFLPILFLAACRTGPDPLAETVAVPGTSIRLEMAFVPGGPRPFWISKREITWAEFDRFVEFPGEQTLDGVTRPSSGKSYLQLSGLPPDFMEADRPVTNVRYHSATVYCEWLSKRTGLIFRLPTEAEWELAARGTESGWTRETSGGGTHPGGASGANPLGIHDLAGNAWEYCLEPDRPPDFEPVLRGGAWNIPQGSRRTTAPVDWSEADPNRPFSLWWFRAGHSQGFRVVRVPEAAGAGEREAYARTIEISALRGRERVARVGTSAVTFVRVSGAVRNGGDRTLDELAIKVYSLDPEGQPHLEDVSANLTRRPTFNVCFPVLTTSAHAGGHARPLAPGERRTFEVDVPASFDPPEHVRADAFGAAVLHLRFAGR